MFEITMNILLYSIVALGIILVVFGVWIFILSQRMNRLLRGKKTANLEETILDLIKEHTKISNQQQYLEKEHLLLKKKTTTSIRGIGFMRFNAFKDSGGNQSFAIALIDEQGNGVIISTLFARERMSVFAKNIRAFACEQQLSNEERSALDQATTNLA
jgi:hypothetical protein